eukprot:g1819.t1
MNGLFTLVLTCIAAGLAQSCTNILVTKEASQLSHALLGDNDDASKRLGAVTRFPAKNTVDTDRREIYDFEGGFYRGSIPEATPRTYNTISHANEFGVVIGETTHGGIESLAGTGVLDYGSLIVTTLQRSKTAREAIDVIEELTSSYGYGSTGEGFSITDGKESWYMELIGKGNRSKGIVYVALRVPPGYFVANANQARITTFLPCDDPSICRMSKDVVSFAKEYGLWNGTNESDFSFSDVYDPVTATGARFCEARVWEIYKRLAHPDDFNASFYLPYAQGFNLSRRMPLFVRPRKLITREEVHDALSSFYQETWLDPAIDVGAGPERSPYRWNGLTWTYENNSYVNERIIGTQYTAWHFVATVDPSVSWAPMRALLYFGSDDHAHSPKVPIFGGASAVHKGYDDANCSARIKCREAAGLPGSMLSFSWSSAYWVNSAVARLVYGDVSRASPIVRRKQRSFQTFVDTKVAETKSAALRMIRQGNEKGALRELNVLALTTTEAALEQWKDLWGEIMVTLADGLTASADKTNELCGCKKETPTFPAEWLGKVVADTGSKYRLPGKNCEYIDPDGHCHHGGALGAASSIETAKANAHRPIPKHLVPGVRGL